MIVMSWILADFRIPETKSARRSPPKSCAGSGAHLESGRCGSGRCLTGQPDRNDCPPPVAADVRCAFRPTCRKCRPTIRWVSSFSARNSSRTVTVSGQEGTTSAGLASCSAWGNSRSLGSWNHPCGCPSRRVFNGTRRQITARATPRRASTRMISTS